MPTHSEFLKKSFQLFLGIFIPVFIAVTIVSSWKIALVLGALSALFMSVHLGRTLAVETFEINATNKDPTKGLKFYEEEIIRHMRDLRYRLVIDHSELKVWQPSLRAQVMGGEFKMEVTPYAITITGPRGAVRIMKSILDIDKIFI